MRIPTAVAPPLWLWPHAAPLAVFLSLSRYGPLGSWGLLFTPQAMVIAQTILVAPIIAALTRQTIEDLWVEYRDELAAMNVGPARRVATLVWDARFSLVTALPERTRLRGVMRRCSGTYFDGGRHSRA
jgi:ABC-type tungstate transport system substrate-binding protein